MTVEMKNELIQLSKIGSNYDASIKSVFSKNVTDSVSDENPKTLISLRYKQDIGKKIIQSAKSKAI